MIKINKINKSFGKKLVIKDLSCTISDGGIFGLVGSNGAGKSTLLRLITGIFKPESGTIKIDGEDGYDNEEVKSNNVFISDDFYYPEQATIKQLSKIYAGYYETFNYKLFNNLLKEFKIDENPKISSLSKGMKRQVMIIIALSCSCKYTFLDETLDGLDPIVRTFVKNKLFQHVLDTNSTIVITSHSLRELEDTCDEIAMIHDGKIILQGDLESIKDSIVKIQIAFNTPFDKTAFNGLEIVKYSQTGAMAMMIVEGEQDTIIQKLKSKNPVILEQLNLSLEEIFIYRLREHGYYYEDIETETNLKEVQ